MRVAFRPTVALLLALVTGACGLVPSPSITPSPSNAATHTAGASTSPAAPSAEAGAAIGLGDLCSAQWAASLSGYADREPRMLTAILVPPADSSAPVLEPTSATLQTDRGPVELSVAMASNSEHDTPWGTTRLDLFLPSLEPGTYRAEFLDLVDASGAWRFGIGRVVIRIDPGTGPADLERLGGTIESNADEGGSVQGFDLLVLNVADAPVEVTGVSTDIPGLPVSWVLLDPAARQVIDAVAIPPGTEARVTAGTDSDAGPVAFVQATPELVYRVGDAQRRMLVDPILFTNGFGVPADVTAYRETLPATSCAARI